MTKWCQSIPTNDKIFSLNTIVYFHISTMSTNDLHQIPISPYIHLLSAPIPYYLHNNNIPTNTCNKVPKRCGWLHRLNPCSDRSNLYWISISVVSTWWWRKSMVVWMGRSTKRNIAVRGKRRFMPCIWYLWRGLMERGWSSWGIR